MKTDKHKEQLTTKKDKVSSKLVDNKEQILEEFNIQFKPNIRDRKDVAYTGFISLRAKIRIKRFLLKAISQTQQDTIKQVKINIGFLRQWLNERSSDKLLTNEDLETWLLDKLKKG